MTPLAKIRRRLKARGTIRAQELVAQGVAPEQLQRWVRQGALKRRSRGVYALPEQPPGEHASLAEACLRSPQGVICLLSALSFHGIGTQMPPQVWLALPKGAHTPRWSELAIHAVHLASKFHEADIETHTTDDGEVRVYAVARTLVDLFRFRGTVGLDVFLEAVREAIRARRTTWDEIWQAAARRGVGTSIRPYLEAM